MIFTHTEVQLSNSHVSYISISNVKDNNLWEREREREREREQRKGDKVYPNLDT